MKTYKIATNHLLTNDNVVEQFNLPACGSSAAVGWISSEDFVTL